MNREYVLTFLNKNGDINNMMLKRNKHLSIEQLYCWYHGLDIKLQEFAFLSFKKGYSKNRFKKINNSIRSAADIIRYEHLVVDCMGRVNGNLIGHLNISNERVYNILKGGVRLCPGCGSTCTFKNFKKGYSKNCGRNSCVAVYSSIIANGKKTKEGRYRPEWNHWYNKTEAEKKLCLKIRAIKTRKTRELKGTYRKITDIDDYELYFSRTSFKHGFKPNNEEEIKLLKEHGVFNNINNTKGCVRDHLLSRRYGFENNIPTWIISHPANCEIVLHSENVRRSSSNDNLITLEELLERIENWK